MVMTASFVEPESMAVFMRDSPFVA
jgi:hypothetical protein